MTHHQYCCENHCPHLIPISIINRCILVISLYHISHNTNMMIIKKIQQIGHSMGGGIALAAAGTSPELSIFYLWSSQDVQTSNIYKFNFNYFHLCKHTNLQHDNIFCAVFEPNLFSLLAGGGSEDQEVSFFVFFFRIHA